MVLVHDFIQLTLTQLKFTVISRQSSPPFACVPSRRARDPSPLCSPSLHLNLTHPHQPSCALSTASPLLTRLAWDVLIPGRAAVESVNSWREGFRGARTGSGGAVMGPWYQDGLPESPSWCCESMLLQRWSWNSALQCTPDSTLCRDSCP
jgi:hypothetical protein